MHDSELHATVLALEQQVWKAVLQKDGTALAKLFAENYIEITVDGKRIAKGEIVAMSPRVDEIDTYAMDSERVVALGERSAILSYHLTLDGRSGGVPITPRERWATSVWTCRDGQWVCCLFQQSAYRLP